MPQRHQSKFLRHWNDFPRAGIKPKLCCFGLDVQEVAKHKLHPPVSMFGSRCMHLFVSDTSVMTTSSIKGITQSLIAFNSITIFEKRLVTCPT